MNNINDDDYENKRIDVNICLISAISDPYLAVVFDLLDEGK
jgi:hypothetical protein